MSDSDVTTGVQIKIVQAPNPSWAPWTPSKGPESIRVPHWNYKCTVAGRGLRVRIPDEALRKGDVVTADLVHWTYFNDKNEEKDMYRAQFPGDARPAPEPRPQANVQRPAPAPQPAPVVRAPSATVEEKLAATAKTLNWCLHAAAVAMEKAGIDSEQNPNLYLACFNSACYRARDHGVWEDMLKRPAHPVRREELPEDVRDDIERRESEGDLPPDDQIPF